MTKALKHFNPSAHLNQMGEMLTGFTKGLDGFLEFVCINGSVVIREVNRYNAAYPLIIRFSASCVTDGLTTSQWAKAESQICKFHDKGYLR